MALATLWRPSTRRGQPGLSGSAGADTSAPSRPWTTSRSTTRWRAARRSTTLSGAGARRAQPERASHLRGACPRGGGAGAHARGGRGDQERGVLIQELIDGSFSKFRRFCAKLQAAMLREGKEVPTFDQCVTDALQQVIYSLKIFQVHFNGVHGDLHPDNIFIKYCDETLYRGCPVRARGVRVRAARAAARGKEYGVHREAR